MTAGAGGLSQTARQIPYSQTDHHMQTMSMGTDLMVCATVMFNCVNFTELMCAQIAGKSVSLGISQRLAFDSVDGRPDFINVG